MMPSWSETMRELKRQARKEKIIKRVETYAVAILYGLIVGEFVLILSDVIVGYFCE